MGNKSIPIFKITRLIFFTIFLLIRTLPAHAEIKTFIKEYTYQASEYDSKSTARILALEQVKRLLLEELGTYLESETEVKNFQLSQDRIVAYTAGIVRAEITNEKWDGKSYYLMAKMQADPQEVYKLLNDMLKNLEKTKELEKARKRAEELLREVQILKNELAAAKNKKGSVATQKKKKYQMLVNSISAIDWYNVGKYYYKNAYPPDIKYATISFNRAIAMNPRFAEAYYERGIIHSGDTYNSYSYPLTFANKAKAIEDFNMAIHLDPKLSEAWGGLIGIYSSLRDYKQALNYCEKAIEVNADSGDLYRSRAWLHLRMRTNIQQAIRDLTKAIGLETDSKYPYYLYFERGDAYKKIGDYQNALNDYNKGLDIRANWASESIIKINIKTSLYDEQYIIRAQINAALGNYQQAIHDYAEIIKLHDKEKEKALAKKSSYVPEVPAKLYYYRGMLYDKLGSVELASKDFDRAFQLPSPNVPFIDAENLLKEGKYIESLQAFNRGVELALPRMPNETENIKLWGHFIRSFIYTKLKNYQQALREVDSFIQQSNGVIDRVEVKRAVLCLRSMIYWKIGKFDDSIQYIGEVIKIDPSDPFPFKVRGTYYLLRKKYQQALADFEKVVKIDYQNNSYTLGELKNLLPGVYEENGFPNFFNIVQSLFPMEQESEIYKNFEILAEKYPKFKSTYDSYLTNYWEKNDLPTKDDPSHKKDGENEWIKIGKAMTDSYNYAGAIEVFTKALEHEPQNADMYALRGDAYFKIEKYHDALKDYEKAISLQPDKMSFYVKHSNACYYLEDYQKIITDFEIIVKKYPSAETLLCRGRAYELLGKYDQAFVDYDKSLEIEKSTAPLLRRGSMHMERGDYNLAIQDINQAITYYLKSRAIKNGDVLNAKWVQFSELELTLRESLLWPSFNKYSAYEMRGTAYTNLGNYQRAIEDYNEAIRLKPNYAGLYVSRGDAYDKFGQQQRAIEDFNEAIRLKPDYARAYNNRAVTYLSQGNEKLGCPDAQKACELGVCNVFEYVKGKGLCR